MPTTTDRVIELTVTQRPDTVTARAFTGLVLVNAGDAQLLLDPASAVDLADQLTAAAAEIDTGEAVSVR